MKKTKLKNRLDRLEDMVMSLENRLHKIEYPFKYEVGDIVRFAPPMSRVKYGVIIKRFIMPIEGTLDDPNSYTGFCNGYDVVEWEEGMSIKDVEKADKFNDINEEDIFGRYKTLEIQS